MRSILLGSLAAVVLWVGAWSSVSAQTAEAQSTTTLWNFLGIPQATNKILGATLNRRGNHPGLEKRPALKSLADPANLKSDVPAIKAAAEIKQAEDMKRQKIKAIRYLATIGCGCYDKDEKVTKALLAAMEDCTEEVRLEAVRAISVAASGEYCVHCKQRSCCNEKITAMLYKIAYELDDLGCYVEPSERVRQAAIEALGICCPNALPITGEVVPEGTIEGATPEPAIEGAPATPPTDVPPPPPVNDAARTVPSRPVDPNAFLRDASLALLDRMDSQSPASGNQPSEASLPPQVLQPTQAAPPPASHVIDPTPIAVPYEPAPIRELAQPPAGAAPSSRRTAKTKSVSASIAPRNAVQAESIALRLVDVRRNLAHVHFGQSGEPMAVGNRLLVYRPGPTGLEFRGEVEVVETFPGSATVRPLGDLHVSTLPRETVFSR